MLVAGVDTDHYLGIVVSELRWVKAPPSTDRGEGEGILAEMADCAG